MYGSSQHVTSCNTVTSVLLLCDQLSCQMRSAFVWGITQRVVVILHRRFGTTYRSHLQTSGNPRTQQKECRSHLPHVGSLKSASCCVACPDPQCPPEALCRSRNSCHLFCTVLSRLVTDRSEAGSRQFAGIAVGRTVWKLVQRARTLCVLYFSR